MRHKESAIILLWTKESTYMADTGMGLQVTDVYHFEETVC